MFLMNIFAARLFCFKGILQKYVLCIHSKILMYNEFGQSVKVGVKMGDPLRLCRVMGNDKFRFIPLLRD